MSRNPLEKLQERARKLTSEISARLDELRVVAETIKKARLIGCIAVSSTFFARLTSKRLMTFAEYGMIYSNIPYCPGTPPCRVSVNEEDQIVFEPWMDTSVRESDFRQPIILTPKEVFLYEAHREDVSRIVYKVIFFPGSSAEQEAEAWVKAEKLGESEHDALDFTLHTG